MHNTVILGITLTQLLVLAWVLFFGPWRPLIARREHDVSRTQPSLAPAVPTPPPVTGAAATSPTPRLASDRSAHCAFAFDAEPRRQAPPAGDVS